MKEDVHRMACGGCGHREFAVYNQWNEQVKLIVECLKCKSTTEITASTPHLELEFGENSNGRLCDMGK